MGVGGREGWGRRGVGGGDDGGCLYIRILYIKRRGGERGRGDDGGCLYT